MKVKFTVTILVIFVCILYTNSPAIANPANKDQDLEEGCLRSCLSDYSKIAKCDINEMISEYILETNNEN